MPRHQHVRTVVVDVSKTTSESLENYYRLPKEQRHVNSKSFYGETTDGKFTRVSS